MGSLRPREKNVTWGPQLNNDGAKPLTPEKFSALSHAASCAHKFKASFYFSPGKAQGSLLQWLNDSKKELLFLWANIDNLKLCLGQDFCKMLLLGQLQQRQGLPGATGSPYQVPNLTQTTSPLQPHKSLQKVCQTGPMCSFLYPWHSAELLPIEREHMQFTHMYWDLWHLSKLIRIWDWDKVRDP